MNYQNNRNTCSCNSCSYGRTPWSNREACSCGRRPWTTRNNNCNSCSSARSSSCPCTANTTWRNRAEGYTCDTARTDSCSFGTVRSGFCSACGSARTGTCSSCGTSRIDNCPCAESRETRTTCPRTETRDNDCDEDCNLGARNTGILDGKSLAMVYSPYQNFESLYDPRQGLCNGTIFCGLDKPFYGDRRDC